MSIKTRKHIWPVSLVMSIAIVGALAAFLVLGANPGPTQAQEDKCATASGDALELLRELGLCPADTSDTAQEDKCATATGDALELLRELGLCPAGNGSGIGGTGDMIVSTSDTGSAAVKLTLTIDLEQSLTGSSWVEIYLEDDYQEPGSIAKENVIFEARGTPTTGDSGVDVDTTFAAAAVEIDDGGKIENPDPTKDDDEDVVVISARIPDMKDGDATGYPKAGQTLIMVVSKAAGIKNPSEAGSHSVGFSIIGGTDDRADKAGTKLDDLKTKAKISLSADDGGRGKEITITGTGFNKGTTAEAFVLVADTKPVDEDGNDDCEALVANSNSESLGTAAVGSDDKFSIAFTVHQDEFKPGTVNWICAKDSESEGGNRYSSDVDSFEVKDSLSITPEAVASGEEVTLKPRDFMSSATLEYVYLGGTGEDDTLMCCGSDDPVQADGSDYVFDMPGGYSGSLRITVRYSDGAQASDTITVEPSSLTLSATEVAPNQSIVISGSGFSEKSYIKVSDITIDDQPLIVEESGSEDVSIDGETVEVVKTTSTGEFTASVKVWSDSTTDNPALSDGTYKIEAEDVEGFSGSAMITILAPTLMVTPTSASPRDYIVISGANWPVSTSDDDREVKINVDGRNRNTGVDSTGRFNYEYQLRSTIQIGKEHTITVSYGMDDDDPGSIEEEITFIVPSSNVTIIPAAAAPGETITLEITGMPIIRLVEEVVIAGADRLRDSYTTDTEGNVTVEGIVVPFADPGFFPVRITVGDDTAVVQLEILAEDTVRGAASPLPEAVTDLGDSLVRIFHFNTSSKVWTFYDPRPEFDGLNTLTELAAGQPYWILVSEDVENVVLNRKTRDLTCVGGDCWNQLVW